MFYKMLGRMFRILERFAGNVVSENRMFYKIQRLSERSDCDIPAVSADFWAVNIVILPQADLLPETKIVKSCAYWP